jgi:signal transduction histidine kinase
MNINLALVEQELPPGATSALRERVVDLRSLAAQTLEQIHELALNLRPALLDELGLVPALRWYLAQCASQLHLQAELEVLNGEERLAAEVETVLFRAVQEALTNVARHAQTNRVRVRLARRKSRVVLTIEDDGRGFEVEEVMGRATAAHGMGLVGMRERVASLGGRFDLQSRPGQGTRLSIEIPV